jgi:hypothetical protein
MKVQNLLGYPVQLGDGRIIGAAGTDADKRDYLFKELTAEDQKRFERGDLRVEKLLAPGSPDAQTVDTTKKDKELKNNGK